MAGTGLAVAPTAPAQAASADVVVSEVYGGGGNTGAPYANDFVELRNNGTASVSVAGWSVQYASAGGTTWSNKTALTGSIAAGGTYLVNLASGGAVGAALPTPQVTGTTNLSATAGKVALVTNNTALTCGANCDKAAGVKDFVGYGTANDYETAAAPSGSNTASLTRQATADSDNNSVDFRAVAPTPGTSSGPGGGGGGCAGTRIHTVQRASHTGLTGSVSALPGVVTARSTNGFWMQETDACVDSDPETSEGIYVASAAGPAPGTSVKVSGTVTEVRPGGDAKNLSTTTITGPTITTVAAGQALPAATSVGTGGRVPPASVIDNDATGSVETSGSFDGATDGIDFWESMEGMRVSVVAPHVVASTNSYGETVVVPNGSGTRTPRGGILVTATDFNPERVLLDDVLSTKPSAQTGDTLGSQVTGVLDYSFGNFKLLPTATPVVTAGTLAPEVTATPAAGTLAAATFNVENLDPTDPQSKFDGLAAQVVTNLRSPDLIAVEELQDNNGATNDAVVSASTTITKLISAISAKGGPTYQYRQVNPVDDQDGGEPGGNIRVAFLYRTDRGLAFVDRGTPSSTAGITVTGSGTSTALSTSPGRIDPGNTAWAATRKPLAGEFTWNGKKVFAIANHFSSKGGDDPLFGVRQPPTRSSETKRHQQAQVVRSFTTQLLTADPSARVVVLGDINDFEFSETTNLLVGSGTTALTSLPRTLPANERYSYVFEGNSQILDQILVSQGWAGEVYDIVHINAEFRTQLSDHDPSVARLTW